MPRFRTVLVIVIVPPVRAPAGAVSAVMVRSARLRGSNVRTNVWPLDSVSGASIHATLGVPAASTVIHGVKPCLVGPEMPVLEAEPVPTSVQRPTRASQPRTKIDELVPPPPAHAAIGPLRPGASEMS